MKKIKNFIIHLLGGVTLDEWRTSICRQDLKAELQTFQLVKLYMDSLFGSDASTWCQSAYDFVSRKESELSDAMDVIEAKEAEESHG